jgi:nucleoside-triphosphatase THEP1
MNTAQRPSLYNKALDPHSPESHFVLPCGMRYIIITGPRKAGKSCSLLKTAGKLRASGIPLGGVITKRAQEHSEGDDREIVAPGGTEAVPFCSRIEWGARDDVFKEGNFYFSKSAFAMGNAWIRAGLESGVVFIDEIGGLEMTEDNEYKWDFALPLAQDKGKKQTLLFAVKENLLDGFIEKYNFSWKIIRAENGADVSERILAETEY